MNNFIKAIRDMDADEVKKLISLPKWQVWAEPDGKNALHYLCAVPRLNGTLKADASLDILKLLLKKGIDINSVQKITGENCEDFPATPLWYAYTRGRNEKLYKYLLKQGADTRNCWWAIAWYDDVAAGKLWLKHGAVIDVAPTLDQLFVGTFKWKKYAFAKWLLEKGADVNAFDADGVNALMMAVKRKDDDAIKWLIRSGADPDLRGEIGESARSFAISKGPKRILELL